MQGQTGLNASASSQWSDNHYVHEGTHSLTSIYMLVRKLPIWCMGSNNKVTHIQTSHCCSSLLFRHPTNSWNMLSLGALFVNRWYVVLYICYLYFGFLFHSSCIYMFYVLFEILFPSDHVHTIYYVVFAYGAVGNRGRGEAG